MTPETQARYDAVCDALEATPLHSRYQASRESFKEAAIAEKAQKPEENLARYLIEEARYDELSAEIRRHPLYGEAQALLYNY